MLTVIDEFTRRCMAVVVERRLNSDNVLHCLTELFVQHGPPDHIRSDNGSEFTAHAVRDWLGRIGVKTSISSPGHLGRTRHPTDPVDCPSHRNAFGARPASGRGLHDHRVGLARERQAVQEAATCSGTRSGIQKRAAQVRPFTTQGPQHLPAQHQISPVRGRAFVKKLEYSATA